MLDHGSQPDPKLTEMKLVDPINIHIAIQPLYTRSSLVVCCASPTMYELLVDILMSINGTGEGFWKIVLH